VADNEKMIVFPNAKINLGLNVIEKRLDGFHNLESLFVPYFLCDILEVVQEEKFSMNLYGIKYDGKPMDNLCVKAYDLLKEIYDLPPVGIYLFKKIPVGAGLGGGSSDATSTLCLLNKMFSLNISDNDLSGYAVQLGSDCAFFIYNKPMIARGRGEILTPYNISFDNYIIELVVPSIFVSTKDAYTGIIPNKPAKSLQEVLSYPIEEWKELLVNDFEKSIFLKYPLLALEKEALYERGAVYASMSGSGSSLYGIFRK